MIRPLTFAMIGALAGATPALAQTAQSPAQQQNRQTAPQPQGQGQLEPGANSFTEGQVRSRLEGAGYQNVADLRKDEQGIWRARAMRNGQQVTVGLDFNGTIAAGEAGAAQR